MWTSFRDGEVATGGGRGRPGTLTKKALRLAPDYVCLQLNQAGKAKVTLPPLGKFFQVAYVVA
jgi:hypothetical protein